MEGDRGYIFCLITLKLLTDRPFITCNIYIASGRPCRLTVLSVPASCTTAAMRCPEVFTIYSCAFSYPGGSTTCTLLLVTVGYTSIDCAWQSECTDVVVLYSYFPSISTSR